MTDIPLIDLFGPICVDPENCAKLRDELHSALNRGETVRLDLTGITTLASAFLSTATGCLYAFLSKDDLDRRLLLTGLDPSDDAVMRLVQRNAIRFYSANQSQRDALLSAAARYPGE
jgi:hypothetical protein